MAADTKHRKTRQGDAVKAALLGLDGFRSAQDVYATLRSAGDSVGLSTVYRHLQAFADSGLVDVIQTPDGEATYRFCGDATEKKHHHHLVCRECGRAEEIEARAFERWSAEVATKFGYTDVEHTVEVFGTCGDCAR
ncbi:Fur family transcriptional regulator, ferric uptake regulator [Frankineae bacterium MT45]|nr:Fur family transcriptional regulator, ferric uptake regulator [Frankineae bacterium MT45]